MLYLYLCGLFLKRFLRLFIHCNSNVKIYTVTFQDCFKGNWKSHKVLHKIASEYSIYLPFGVYF
jgi:hypothetical protein